MAQTTAHLIDYVIPHVPVRQCVRVCRLRLPMPLRLLAAKPKRETPVLQVVHREVTRFLLVQGGLNGAVDQQGLGDVIDMDGRTS